MYPMQYLFFIFLFFITLLESSLNVVPLTLLFLLCFTLAQQSALIFPVAFIAGILLDILSVRPLGETGLFYILFLFFILLYQRKYEITTVPFVFFTSFFGCLLFFLIFGFSNLFIQLFLSIVLAILIFLTGSFLRKKEPDNKQVASI